MMMKRVRYGSVLLLWVIMAGACSSNAPDISTASTAAAGVQTTTTIGVARELVVPAVIAEDVFGASISGWLVERDGEFLLCEGLSEDDPPGCLGEAVVISNGEVLLDDPDIFDGEPGSRYSDAESVVTGDVVDGVLTIK